MREKREVVEGRVRKENKKRYAEYCNYSSNFKRNRFPNHWFMVASVGSANLFVSKCLLQMLREELQDIPSNHIRTLTIESSFSFLVSFVDLIALSFLDRLC